jgi:hypothetical protein
MLQARHLGKWDRKTYDGTLAAEKPERPSYTWKGDRSQAFSISVQ